MKNFFTAIWGYLKDWKNLLVHSLVGFGLLGIALFLPVPVYFRIGILVAVVIFNVVRGRLAARKKAGGSQKGTMEEVSIPETPSPPTS